MYAPPTMRLSKSTASDMTFLIEAHLKLHVARVTTLMSCEYFGSLISALNRTADSGGELGSDEVRCERHPYHRNHRRGEEP